MPEIVIYTRRTCGPCVTLKAWLRRKGLAFIEKNVDDSPELAQEAYEASGYLAVPVTVIRNQAIVGPNYAMISRILGS